MRRRSPRRRSDLLSIVLMSTCALMTGISRTWPCKADNKKPPSTGKVWGDCGAGDEIRTRDIYLGKVVLYQLSYSRNKKNPRTDRLFRAAASRVS